MRVLVTGATGFIGKHLCEMLLNHGFAVRGTFRTKPSSRTDAVEWVHVRDIIDTDWTPVLDGIDFVVHLAALAHQIGKHVDPTAFTRANHLAVERLASACAVSSVRRLVFISSIGAVCSFAEHPVTEAEPCRPETPYGRSKRDAELALTQILTDTFCDWCILRPTLVYGPGNPGNMYRMVRLAGRGLPLPLASVRNRRTFLYVGNLADLIRVCLTHPNASRTLFNVSDQEVFSTPALLTLLGEISRVPVRLFPCPPSVLRYLGAVGDLASTVVRRSIGIDRYSVDRLLGSLEVDNSAIRERLSWNPPFSARAGFAATLSVVDA